LLRRAFQESPMLDLPDRPIPHILLGAGLVALGGAIATILPPALTGVALIVLMLRICWLEDNIKSDLAGARDIPANHRRRDDVRAGRLHETPGLIATSMRGQAQALSAGGFGAVALLVWTQIGWPPAPTLMAGLILLLIGLRRVDRMAVTLSHLDRRQPLPTETLLRAHPWVHSYRMDPEE
jgi:hypothetical protein